MRLNSSIGTPASEEVKNVFDDVNFFMQGICDETRRTYRIRFTLHPTGIQLDSACISGDCCFLSVYRTPCPPVWRAAIPVAARLPADASVHAHPSSAICGLCAGDVWLPAAMANPDNSALVSCAAVGIRAFGAHRGARYRSSLWRALARICGPHTRIYPAPCTSRCVEVCWPPNSM